MPTPNPEAPSHRLKLLLAAVAGAFSGAARAAVTWLLDRLSSPA